MFTEDYVLRMISMAVAALVKIARLKKDGEYQQAEQAINQSLEQLLGLDASLIKQLDDESLLGVLTQQGRVDLERLALLADLYGEEGEIFAAQGRITESRESYLRSLTCLLETAFNETAQPPDLLKEKIDSLILKLGLPDLPDGTLWTSFCYFELIGAFGKAEQAILGLAARPQQDNNIRSELIAFYERLLAGPGGDLDQGELRRDQVERKLEQAKLAYLPE